jgi:hypothetical protein
LSTGRIVASYCRYRTGYRHIPPVGNLCIVWSMEI